MNDDGSFAALASRARRAASRQVVRSTPRQDATKRGQVGAGGRSGHERGPGRHAGGAPRVPFALLVTALIVGGMGLLLLLNTASAANEVQRHDLSNRDASIAAQVQGLRNEVAASAAPGNLAAAAAALGMVPAANPAFLVIGTNGSISVLGSAAPASEVHVAQQPRKKKSTSTAKTTAARTTAARTTAAKATGTKSSAHGGATTSAAGTTTKTAAAKTSPHPTPTPTPTVTLPGGNR